MARKLTLVDDIDGTMATDTIKFSFDGERYEIDLSADHIVELSEALAPFIKAAKVVGKRKVDSDVNLDEVRAWARAHGHKASDRGRISQEVMAAYEAANAAV